MRTFEWWKCNIQLCAIKLFTNDVVSDSLLIKYFSPLQPQSIAYIDIGKGESARQPFEFLHHSDTFWAKFCNVQNYWKRTKGCLLGHWECWRHIILSGHCEHDSHVNDFGRECCKFRRGKLRATSASNMNSFDLVYALIILFYLLLGVINDNQWIYNTN